MIKEIRSSNMERDNRITVIINSKNSEDAEKLYEVITAALRKENHRRNNDISFDVLCVGKGDKKNEEGSCSTVQRAVGD